MNTGLAREALSLWIAPSNDADSSAVLAAYLRCRQALDEFLAGRLPWLDYLELLAANGVDVDEYLEISEDNLIVLGA